MKKLFALILTCGALQAQVYTTYHWHMQQPIYWPDRSQSSSQTYEKAWESIQHRNGGAAHPQNNVEEIFSVADRVAAYQDRVRASIASMSGAASGAQVSYSGCLAENVGSLGENNAYGYSPGWFNGNRTARSWTTPNGKPRLDLVIFPYHHSLAPLVDEAALRMEIRIAKDIYPDIWGSWPVPSVGFFPPELAFSERIIPILADEGIEWSFVPNNHVSRACENFPLTLGTGGENCDPPNKADQINPAQASWFSRTISRGCTPTNAVPFAYRPHKAEYVNPETGEVSRITVVPVAQAMSWIDGYQMYGLDDINQIASQSEPAQPMLIALAHDGDNAWGGGFSYYLESVPQFTAQAVSQGHVPTVVQDYLHQHPVSEADLIHVEDGAWVNADGDFGSPDFINWNWPLVGADGQFNIENGWAEDERNWAVITAAQNRVLTAEQIAGGVSVDAVRDPVTHNASDAELAWHFFLPSLTSGYMYYGAALDMEVKPTVACNEAVSHADNVIGDGSLDQTGPTIWLPQQLPHNPGETGFGALWGYQPVQHDRDFYIWTFIDDVSGLASVSWNYRLDVDGVNPLSSHQNETFAGGPEVGEWVSLPMNQRSFPTGNVYNDPNIDFFELPEYMADQYWIHVTEPDIVDEGGVLIDYFVEAVDNLGNVKRSPILHTWVGTGGGATTPGGRVSWWPQLPQAGESMTVQYRMDGSPLPGDTNPVWMHFGFNGWSSVSDAAMSWNADSLAWQLEISLPQSATQADLVFHDNAGNWDNNSGQDWHVTVMPGEGGGSEWVIDGQLDENASLIAQSGNLELHAGWNGERLYLAANPAAEGRDHFLFVGTGSSLLSSAPWAKSGQVSQWDAYLAQEADNGWCGWFDAGAALPLAGSGLVLEGSLDLAGLLGTIPDGVWLALGGWETADGGPLLVQLPAGDGDGHLEANEWVWFPLETASLPVPALSITLLAGGQVQLSWPDPAAPAGSLVQIEASDSGLAGPYQVLAQTTENSWLDPDLPLAGELRVYRARTVLVP